MILGCLLLLLVLNRYEFKTTVSAVTPGQTSLIASADFSEKSDTVRL